MIIFAYISTDTYCVHVCLNLVLLFPSSTIAPPLVPPSPIRSHGRKPSGGGRGLDAGGRPFKILFVKEMTETICETLPDFWRLGKAYFSGSLFQGVSMLTENQQMLARNCGMNQTRFEVSGVFGGCGFNWVWF